MVLVIRDSGVTHINREGHQEELDGGPEKSGPLCHKSRLHVKLEVETERKKRAMMLLALLEPKKLITPIHNSIVTSYIMATLHHTS